MGKTDKKAVFSACCGDGTTTYHDIAKPFKRIFDCLKQLMTVIDHHSQFPKKILLYYKKP